jgi:ADP-heptose:LPS heptosyltransferase
MTKSKEQQYLRLDTIFSLGFKEEEFRELSNKPNSTKDYYKLNPEYAICKYKNDYTLPNLEGRTVEARKGSYHMLKLVDFINLFNKGKVSPTSIFKKKYNHYRGQSLNRSSVIVWMYGAGFGDILFVQGVIRHLKHEYPNCVFSIAVAKHQMEFAKSFGTFNNVYPTPMPAEAFVEHEYHICFDHLLRSEDGKTINAYKLYREQINAPFIQDFDLYPNIPVLPERKHYINRLFKTHMTGVELNKYIVLQLSTSTRTRNPRIDFRLKLLNRLIADYGDKYKIVFTDTTARRDDIDFLMQKSDNPSKCRSFVNYNRDILDTVALLGQAALVVSVDTGLIHIGTAVGTPVYGIYGPFPGEIRLSTYPDCKWIEPKSEKLTCNPCCRHDWDLCEHAEHEYPVCYDYLDMNRISDDVGDLLKIGK